MNISESFTMAFVNLKSNKLRSFLSMLGIIIGIGSVIVVVSMTNGTKEQVLESIGTADSFIYTLSPQFNPRTNQQVELKPEDLEIFKVMPFVRSVLPKIYKQFEIRSAKKLVKGSISVIDDTYLKTHRLTLLSGRNFNQFDIAQRSRICLISKKLASRLFDIPMPIGQSVHCEKSVFTIIGIVQPAIEQFELPWSESGMEETIQPHDFLIPYMTALRLESDIRLDQVDIYVDKKFEGNVLPEINAAIEKSSKKPVDYSIQDPKQLLAQIEKESLMFSIFIASVAGISLFVGGIGIMNVMLTSVAERTREIGIRKALGASQKDILVQFVVESCVICTVGGLLGILLGTGLSLLLPWLSDNKVASSILYSSLAVSFVFSLLVGLVFGVFPALRASKLSPVEALRVE